MGCAFIKIYYESSEKEYCALEKLGPIFCRVPGPSKEYFSIQIISISFF